MIHGYNLTVYGKCTILILQFQWARVLCRHLAHLALGLASTNFYRSAASAAKGRVYNWANLEGPGCSFYFKEHKLGPTQSIKASFLGLLKMVDIKRVLQYMSKTP